MFFMITAEIHACSLANFHGQYADRHMNLKFMRRVSERERAIRQSVIVKKQIDASFWCVSPVIDNEFRCNIVKVVCGSTRLTPRGSTATLRMLWRNSWSRTGQTHKNWRQFTSTGHFGFVFNENSGRDITWLSWCHPFSKGFICKMFRSH